MRLLGWLGYQIHPVSIFGKCVASAQGSWSRVNIATLCRYTPQTALKLHLNVLKLTHSWILTTLKHWLLLGRVFGSFGNRKVKFFEENCFDSYGVNSVNLKLAKVGQLTKSFYFVLSFCEFFCLLKHKLIVVCEQLLGCYV